MLLVIDLNDTHAQKKYSSIKNITKGSHSSTMMTKMSIDLLDTLSSWHGRVNYCILQTTSAISRLSGSFAFLPSHRAL